MTKRNMVALALGLIGWLILFVIIAKSDYLDWTSLGATLVGVIGAVAFAEYVSIRQRIKPQPSSNAPMGTTRCPGCGVWDHNLPPEQQPRWHYVLSDEPGVGGYDLKYCRACGHVSAWIDGPGLMLNVPMPANAPNTVGPRFKMLPRTEEKLKGWLAANLDSRAAVPGAVCSIEDGSGIGYEAAPDDWLITNSDQVLAFIKRWESKHETQHPSPSA